MNPDSCIEQKGVIEKIDNGFAVVNVDVVAACDLCHSKSSCDIPGKSPRKIRVPVQDGSYESGDEVTIVMKRSLGLQASLIAYLVPFLLVLVALVVFTSLKMNELLAGLFSLLILIPYIFCLYFFRERLKRTFTLTLRKDG
jgi:positive regulator of sigma E activity